MSPFPYIIPVRRVRGAQRVLFTKIARTSVTNSTAETVMNGTITPAGADVLPANFWRVGRSVRIFYSGLVSTDGASPGTLQVRVRLGGVAGTLMLDSGASNLTAGSVNQQIDGEMVLTCQSVGATGTIEAAGWTRRANTKLQMVNAAAVTVDTTVAARLVLTTEQSVADTDNFVRVTNMDATASN